MHTAPAHLESKLRFWDFTVGQIAAAFAGIMLGFVWARFVSPLHGMLGAMSGAYIAALPVIPVFVASQTEFDLAGLVTSALRWRRLEGRYVPGPGQSANGYVLSVERAEIDPAGGGLGSRSAGAVGGTGGEAMIATRTVKGRAGGLPETGELAAVEAIDRTGLIVTSEGAFVRILRVTPPNPLLMSGQEREKTAGTFQRLVSQLKAEETLQFYIDARPVNLAELLAGCRREVQASAGPAPGERSPGARPAGAGAVAAVRGDGGVAAAARRRPGGHRGLRVRGGAVPAPPERRPGGAGVGAAAAAADRAAGAPAAGAPPRGARAPRARRRAALRARGRGHAHRPARRRGGGAAAVGALQPDQGRHGPPDPELGRRAARRARRRKRPGRRPPGGDPAQRSRSRSRASTSAPPTSTWWSIATSSRRSSCTTRRGARRWGGCTGRC